MFCSKCGKETSADAVFCTNCGASLTGGHSTKKRQLSRIAGTIDIAFGGVCAVSNLLILTMILVWVVGDDDLASPVVLAPVGLVVLSLLGVVGGIFALRRKHWVIALIGAIALVLPSALLSLPAVVLTVMAKDEFE